MESQLETPNSIPGPDKPAAGVKRYLDPVDRVTEVLFGLIMVLTFTGSLSVAEAGRDEIRTMLIGALGCNLAWGIIDALLYLMGCLAERGTDLRTLRSVRAAVDSRKAQHLIADALPPIVVSVMEQTELETLHQRLKQLPEPPEVANLHREDWFGGLSVFLWVFLTTLPVAIPFMIMSDAKLAMRISNGIAVGMLFITGYAYGRCAGRNPWLVGGSMVFVGMILVTLTMALGG